MNSDTEQNRKRELENTRFYEIHCHYYPKLLRIARRRDIPRDEIDDMIQDTFLSYYEHYPLTWPNGKIEAMLTRIFRNRCIDYWKKCKKWDVICMEPETMQFYNRNKSALKQKDNLTILIQREQYRRVMDALKEMKEEWASVFVLYIMEDRSIREVSRILGISEALCRMRLMRGRKYLKDKTGFSLEEYHESWEAKKPEAPRGQEAPGSA